MNIINVEEICSTIEEEIKQFAKSCIIRPSVALIEVGENKTKESLIKKYEDACNRVGIYFRYYKYEDGTPELTIINKIKELNNDDYVNGVMINLPLPEKYNEKRLLNAIVNSKDVNGLTDINIGRLISGRKSIMPCSAQAILEILKHSEVSLCDKEIVIIGSSKTATQPLINIFINEGAIVTIYNSKTVDLTKYTSSADIVISSMNEKNLIKAEMIRDDAIVIDAGYNLINNKIYGDVDFDKVSKKASLISKIPNGVDDITISMLLKNTIFCYNNKNK